ncbi:MAG: acyl--CoA ligase [Bacilli bacterium]|nr:acyl--CoA ligase [Bacilli bacterium]
MKIENVNVVNEKGLNDVLFHSPKVDKETSGKITGFASIDKPWLKYYCEGIDKFKIPNLSLYEALMQSSNDHLDDVIFVCADRNNEEITYRKFIDLVDEIAASLKGLGLKPGDNIASTFKDTLEGIALVFAKSKLGLIEHFIDPSNSTESKKELISNSNSKIYFLEEDLIDVDYDNIKDYYDSDNVVILPNLDSSYVRGSYNDTLTFDEFLSCGKNVSLDDFYKYSKDEVSSIMYTGGSTGKSKGVMLTDSIFVSKYYREMISDWKWGRGRKNLCVLPGIIAFGLSEAIISPLLAGETTTLVDCLKIAKFPEYILEQKPQDVACSPIHVEFLMNSPLVDEKTDLSFLEMLPCGGDGMTKDSDERARKFFEEHGAKDSFAQGCGFTESAGAFCYGLGDKNLPGYMGIPLAGNVSAVFDPNTGEELPYNEIGEWGVLTDTAMLGYYGEASHLTSKALKKHADGNIWLHPGDMVHMNENGQIAMHDRTSRTFNITGLKVYPSALETFINEHPGVKKSVITGIKLSDNSNVIAITDQKVPIVNLTLDDEYKGSEEIVADEIDAILKEKAQSYIKIFAYIFRDVLPFTNRGKIDYSRLESEGVQEGLDKKVLIRKFD